MSCGGASGTSGEGPSDAFAILAQGNVELSL